MRSRTEASAGGVVYRRTESGALDIALIRTHERRWQLPKGWIEAGEAPEHAAVREVREEAGVDGEIIGPIDEIEYTFTSTYDPEPMVVHKTVQFYLLRYLGGSTDDHDDEVIEARWVDIHDAQRMLSFRDEKRIVSMAEEALRRVGVETKDPGS